MDLKIIEDAEKEYLECSKNIESLETLESVRLKFLGKKGLIADIMAKFREVPVELKKEFGQRVNSLKNQIEDLQARLNCKEEVSENTSNLDILRRLSRLEAEVFKK